jgi:hypothetical protein
MPEYENPAAFVAALKGDFVNAEIADTPGAVERQEAAGQKKLVESTSMPHELQPSREAFEGVGFVFHQTIDTVFVAASLPDGWTRRATEHAMWSDILDQKGRRRVAVFYKAAFYDRNAHATLLQRFTIERLYTDDHDPHAFAVKDAGTVIKTWEIPEDQRGHEETQYAFRDAIKAEVEKWLTTERPAWRDPTAHWDED